MRHPQYKGRNCFLLVRCSTDQQAGTSIPDQRNLLMAFVHEHELNCVGEAVLDGVTGSVPGARTDIDQIIERKRKYNDFDLLLVQDMSRFTRAGQGHAGKLEFDLQSAGIDVVYVADNLPDGEYAGILKALGFHTANRHAKAISFASARGAQSALESGRMTHCSRPPFAVDRMYVSADGVPRCIIRLMPDGSQQQLDPKTKAVVRLFEGRGKNNHYRKQPDERIILVPGEERLVEAVRRIFQRKFVDGWGYMRIAQELAEAGVPAQSGSVWYKSIVRQILQNPVYVGVGIANRVSRAVYHERSAHSPQPAAVSAADLNTRKAPPQRTRDRSDWVTQVHPALEDFLPVDLKGLAQGWQQDALDRSRSGATPIKDKHVDSPYFLKGILHSTQGNYEMKGRLVGSGKWKKRYYAVNRGKNAPQKGSVLRRVIPAEEVEQAVLAAVKEVLGNMDGLRRVLLDAVKKQNETDAEAISQVDALRQERETVLEKIDLVVDQLGTLGKDIATKKIQKLKARVQEIDSLLAMASAPKRLTTANVEQQVESVVRRLTSLDPSSLPPAALRHLLGLLISRLDVDLETREVRLEIAVPASMVTDPSTMSLTMCLDEGLAHQTDLEAHGGKPLKLADFLCPLLGRPMCVTCRRIAA